MPTIDSGGPAGRVCLISPPLRLVNAGLLSVDQQNLFGVTFLDLVLEESIAMAIHSGTQTFHLHSHVDWICPIQRSAAFWLVWMWMTKKVRVTFYPSHLQWKRFVQILTVKGPAGLYPPC
jgi:hypothetical protein